MLSESKSNDAVDLFDSLPYFDRDLEVFPGLKAKVDAELARETGKISSALHPKVPPAAILFQGQPLLAAELARIEAHQPILPMDTSRYQLPPPPEGFDASEGDWQKALDNAKTQLTHQALRQSNLALLQTYGANSWRIHNYLLEEDAKAYEAALEKIKEETTELNRERKNYQTRVGQQLSSLESKWTELMSNLLQIELANTAAEVEIAALHEKEEQLKTDLGSYVE